MPLRMTPIRTKVKICCFSFFNLGTTLILLPRDFGVLCSPEVSTKIFLHHQYWQNNFLFRKDCRHYSDELRLQYHLPVMFIDPSQHILIYTVYIVFLFLTVDLIDNWCTFWVCDTTVTEDTCLRLPPSREVHYRHTYQQRRNWKGAVTNAGRTKAGNGILQQDNDHGWEKLLCPCGSYWPPWWHGNTSTNTLMDRSSPVHQPLPWSICSASSFWMDKQPTGSNASRHTTSHPSTVRVGSTTKPMHTPEDSTENGVLTAGKSRNMQTTRRCRP